MDGSDENRNFTLELNSGFLELDSMASMQRVGDSQVAAFAAGGSTLLDLDGLSEKTARKAAAEARSELATGHHESERYRVLHEIARGGMGAVLEVHDSDLDRKVAMKVLLRDTRKSGSGSGSDGGGQGRVSTGPVERFIAEAQLTGSLEHPNIVPVHELGLDSQGRVYFTMKRVRGRSLRGVLDKLRQGHAPTLAEFTPAHLLNVLLKVCDAIEFAHSKGIVHRDLKPENIMVGEFGEVLVMDWGLAKQVDSQATDAEGYKLDVSLGASDDDSTRTREGTVSGTPAYMSPEQARGEISHVDQRTDVFCLGAMLYETLCLVPPFLAPTMTAALEAAREHRLLPPRQKLEEVLADKDLARAFSEAGRERARRHAPELVAIAIKAMAEKRERRYPTVRDFKRDLENYQGALPVSARRDHFVARMLKWGKRNPTRAAVWTLVTVVLLLGLGVAAAVQAQFAMEQATSQQRELDLERGKAAEADRALKAEQLAREQADRSARLEKEKAEQERREAAKLAARRAALGPYSKAADLRARSATISNYAMRATSWQQAAEHYAEAIRLDPAFAQAHLELGAVLADLGHDDEALDHLAEADRLTAAETGRGHVEALMSFAMYDLQRKVLSDTLANSLEEVFRRFVPVRDAAEPGSMYAKIAQLFVDLGESHQKLDAFAFLRELDQFADELRKLESQSEGTPLWEIYALLAMFDYSGGTRARASLRTIARRNRNYLEKARELKPNLPVLAWLDSRYAEASDNKMTRIDPWNEFCQRFPYDPRGYFARAKLVQGEKSEAAIADLRQAITLYPSYGEAHRLLLGICVREGNLTQAAEHVRSMRQARGMDPLMVNLMEVELTSSIGDYSRLENLVEAMIKEGQGQGTKALGTAGRILLQSHEYDEMVRLSQRVLALPARPPLAQLLKARALTMKGDFVAAQPLFVELEAAPAALPEEWRGQLASWADHARRYPELMQLTGVPDARDRLDIARILAVSGANPQRWLHLFRIDATLIARIGRNLLPADHMLQAQGQLRLMEGQSGIAAAASRSRAVQCLMDAFEDGYMNRVRIKSDPLLSQLAGEPRLAKFFETR